MKRNSFTLMEMLIVMAIITVLCALFLPVAMKGIAKGRQCQCLGHLKQIGLAIQMYANDWNGALPYAKRHTYADDSQSIVSCLSSYIDNPDTYICESTEKPFKNQYRLSYVYNITGDVMDASQQIGRPAQSIVTGNPAETWILVDARSLGKLNPHFDFADSLWLDGHVEATKED